MTLLFVLSLIVEAVFILYNSVIIKNNAFIQFNSVLKVKLLYLKCSVNADFYTLFFCVFSFLITRASDYLYYITAITDIWT